MHQNNMVHFRKSKGSEPTGLLGLENHKSTGHGEVPAKMVGRVRRWE